MEQISGFLLINKPKGATSFYCVKHVRILLPGKAKVGHSGTLDKEASGLLILCIGRETTKKIDTLLNLDKHYKVRAKLGELTSTLDYTGEVLKTTYYKNITQEKLLEAMKALGTGYKQTPPIYSALKHKGQSLYKLAREKRVTSSELEKIAEQKSRTIKIHKLKLLDYAPPYFTFYAHVSKGTYIRSLANDIANKLNNYATTYELVRTGIGNISLKNAVEFESLKSFDDIKQNLLTLEEIQELIDVYSSSEPYNE